MTAEEMWQKSGLNGRYEAWSFGDDSDRLAELVKCGKKTATCSVYLFYELEHEQLPQVDDYSIILDSKENAVCIIKTTKVYITTFDSISKEHALKEGEGDCSLVYWRDVHKRFFTEELETINMKFDEKLKLVCEEFIVLYPDIKNPRREH